MSFSEEEKNIIEKYFIDFTSALEVHLRIHKGKLSDYWGGIDKDKFSTIIYLTRDGMVVRIIPKWIGAQVSTKRNVSFAQAAIAKWNNNDFKSGDKVAASAIAKHLAGNAKMQLGVENNGNFLRVIPTEKDSSFIALAPLLLKGLSTAQAKQVHESPGYRNFESPPPTPPWIVSIVSSSIGLNVLAGLDEDPYIAAKGIADIIFKTAGITDEDPAIIYRKARNRLEKSIAAINSENEKELQKVIEEYPWILLDEVDYSAVDPEKTLQYVERTAGDDGVVSEIVRKVRPDFIYEKYDQSSLVVEIEAASKRLLVKTKETHYQLPSAQEVAAQFQIQHYKHICSGPFGSQINAYLEKPDDWIYNYLLVVGSDKQPDFDRRSWNLLREFMKPHGIVLRDWDYYIDRLARFEAAATTANTTKL
ncbi:Shedu anti-phage system protein SduA domain-containing protein [Methylophaga sp. UBA1464]|uniref:Shedu anti-phage system protein SduA domain-containing protein n=1 Tax=Methylophaga sp. UBA1464 TaxID=1946866 RepID=UPI0025E1BC1C|nr:Shedu anti-phage system protein SduA domain-containing protein [Methylophaga sp. UBA1464]